MSTEPIRCVCGHFAADHAVYDRRCTMPACECPRLESEVALTWPAPRCACGSGPAKDCNKHLCKCGVYTVSQDGDRLCCVKKERDEALAEVARLRALIDECVSDIDSIAGRARA